MQQTTLLQEYMYTISHSICMFNFFFFFGSAPFFISKCHNFYAVLHSIPLGHTNKIFKSWQMLIVAPSHLPSLCCCFHFPFVTVFPFQQHCKWITFFLTEILYRTLCTHSIVIVNITQKRLICFIFLFFILHVLCHHFPINWIILPLPLYLFIINVIQYDLFFFYFVVYSF